MFPFFPFGFVPPFPFLFPFAAMMRPSGAEAAERDETGRPTAPFGIGMGPGSMMSLAMMPAMAPFALGSRLAQVVEDAGQVAAQVKDSLDRDEGPVHVVVGDPDGPLGLAIGITFMKGTARARLQDTPAAAAPQLADMVDVTPPRRPN